MSLNDVNQLDNDGTLCAGGGVGCMVGPCGDNTGNPCCCSGGCAVSPGETYGYCTLPSN